MSEKHNFGISPVTCHAINGDRTDLALLLKDHEVKIYKRSGAKRREMEYLALAGLALSLNDDEVKIYKRSGAKWQETESLGEHGQRVTGIDWAAKSNRIVTCGADRNAYVWTLEDGKWKPHLVILRINRAATCVKWSPEENKFAVGSSARLISVSYYEDEHNWWVSKHIKKPIRSTVTCIDWHPNNPLIAAGSTDFKTRVFSGYVKEVESKPSSNTWGSKMTFANLMAEFSNGGGGGGWVHSVSFSPSGDKIAWVGHDSSVSVADSTKENRLTVIRDNFLPFLGITWVTENSMVAAGFDCNPMVLTYDAGKGALSLVSKLDIPQEKTAGTVSAMSHFRNMDKKASSGEKSSELRTQHQNTITQVSVFEGTREKCKRISTSGIDGSFIVWDLVSLEKSIQALKIA